MAFEQILSVSGKSGLFRLVGQMKNGIIVESISDGKRFPVHGSSKVSALEEISIYTESEEVPLKEVFTKMYEKESGKSALDPKEGNDKVRAYFEDVLPDYDKERVYISDMVKVVRWYNELVSHNAFDPNEKKEDEVAQETEVEAKEKATTEEKGAKKESKKAEKKPAAKKAAVAKNTAKASSKPKASISNARSTGAQRGS
jgi:hypothetical protein